MADTKTLSDRIPALEKLAQQSLLAKAAQLARAGRYAEAEAILQDLRETYGASAPVLDLLARVMAQQGRLGEAEFLWTQALQKDPANEDYRAGLRRLAQFQRQGSSLFDLPRMLLPLLAAILLVVLIAGAWASSARNESNIGGLARNVAALETAVAAPPSNIEVILPTPDQALTFAVQAALEADPDLAVLHLSVRQSGQGIFLGGSVPSQELKARVEEVARAVPGVELVDGSGVQVIAPSLAEAVRQALRADPRTACLAVSVEQYEHSVRLTALVPHADTKAIVESVAQDVNGVLLVDGSGILVKPPFTEYTVREGDSLPLIALRVYGDIQKEVLIYAANLGGITLPLLPGTRLAIPPADWDSASQAVECTASGFKPVP
jgi:osmotically-inducible protein OsmY